MLDLTRRPGEQICVGNPGVATPTLAFPTAVAVAMVQGKQAVVPIRDKAKDQGAG
jgi:hypothetical protein